MDSREDLAAALPAPQDDEPSHLRQDIVDELADHLACAMQQALATAPNAQIARDRVRARFGDPQRIAIQLYWDALWEKVMLKRIHLGLTIFLAMALLATCGLLWQSVVQGQHLALEMQRAANDRLVQQLLENNKQLAQERLNGQLQLKTPEWNAVKLRLVQGAAGGPPAPGFKINVQKYDLDVTSDSDGRADLGLVQPGNYFISITAPWKETASTTFTVTPGKDLDLEFVCPTGPIASAEVDLQVDWPAEWRERDIFLVYETIRQGRKIGNLVWGSGNPMIQMELLACRQNARNELEWGRGPLGVMGGGIGGMGGGMQGGGGGGFFAVADEASPSEPGDSAEPQSPEVEVPSLQEIKFGPSRLPFDGYAIRIVRVCVLERRLSTPDAAKIKIPEKFRFLAVGRMMAINGGMLGSPLRAHIPFQLQEINLMAQDLLQTTGNPAPANVGTPAASIPEFIPGSQTSWKLPLPQAIINQVHERLNEKPKPEPAEAKQE